MEWNILNKSHKFKLLKIEILEIFSLFNLWKTRYRTALTSGTLNSLTNQTVDRQVE